MARLLPRNSGAKCPSRSRTKTWLSHTADPSLTSSGSQPGRKSGRASDLRTFCRLMCPLYSSAKPPLAHSLFMEQESDGAGAHAPQSKNDGTGETGGTTREIEGLGWDYEV
jgi:hypothetical protein